MNDIFTIKLETSPTKLSQLSNDAGYITQTELDKEYYTKEEVNNLIKGYQPTLNNITYEEL